MALSEIAFLGDVHARMNALETAMQNCARRGIDTLLQVGDFWLYTEKDLTKFNRVRDRIEDQFGVLVDVHFIDGNHENFDLLGDTAVTKEMTPFMTYHGRGDIFTIKDVTIATFGGAVSIDKFLRTEGRDWWPQEKPAASEYYHAAQRLGEYGGDIDVFVSHDCPESMSHIFEVLPHVESQQVRLGLDNLYNLIQSPYIVHGHWHVPRATRFDNKTTLLSLGIEQEPRSLARILSDTEIEFMYKDSSEVVTVDQDKRIIVK